MMSKKMKGLLSAAMVLCMIVTLFTMSAYAANASVSCTVNQDVGSIAIYKGTSNIQSCSYNGSIPNGLQLSYVGADIYLTGTPTGTGTYTADISMQTDAGAASFTLTVTVSDASTPIQTAPPVINTAPVITKNPTGETVEVGGSAQFVARADGATSFVWRIVSADTTNTVTADEAPWYFSGLQVSGQDTERLTLSNIPKSMNGWAIECKFTNAAGSSFTTGAILTVTGGTSNSGTNNGGNSGSNNSSSTGGGNNTNTNLKAPTLSSQPKGATLSSGETTTLSVTASAPASGTLTYQWYISDTNKVEDMKAIDGANSASYTPTQTEGTKYYRVGVWVSKDGQKSTTTYSQPVEVSFDGGSGTSDPNASLPPLGTPQPSPTAAPSATPIPTDNGGNDGSYDRGNSSALIFYIVVAGLALLAVGGILVYLVIVNTRKGRDDDDE